MPRYYRRGFLSPRGFKLILVIFPACYPRLGYAEMAWDAQAGSRRSIPQETEGHKSEFYSFVLGLSVKEDLGKSRVTFDFRPGVQKELDADQAGYELGTRTFWDRLALDWKGQRHRFSLGMQKITWGETFGFNIIDIVNPSDFTMHPLDDPSESKIATDILIYQYIRKSWDLQLLFIPYPIAPILPETIGGFPVATDHRLDPDNSAKVFEDGEVGTRLTTVFDDGLSASLFVFDHWNRVPAAELVQLDDGSLAIEPIYRRVFSVGASFSYGGEQTVFRGDTIFNQGLPITDQSIGRWHTSDQVRTVLGADYDGFLGILWGVQVYSDSYLQDPPIEFKDKFLSWASGRAQKPLFDNALDAELFLFGGIDNSDRLARPKLTWHAGDNLDLAVQGDFVSGKEEGNLVAVDKEDRVMVSVKATW